MTAPDPLEAEPVRFFFDEPLLILAMSNGEPAYFYATHMVLMPDGRMIPTADNGAHAPGAHAVLDIGCVIEPEWFGEWSQEEQGRVLASITNLKQFLELTVGGNA